MTRKRKRGSVLVLVLACIAVIIIVGVAIFFLTKVLGGGRELANATDSGAMNIAKHALSNPHKSALAFNNPDIASNFAVLAGQPDDINLMKYNSLVAHAVLVAYNAREENTVDSARNAHKVWSALNEVGSYLHTELIKPSTMEPYFKSLVDSNNTRMLGNNNISLSTYRTSFMRKGGATNIFVDPRVVAAVNATADFPISNTGPTSPQGFKYMAGYKPIEVTLGATGEKLSFLGVPVGPQDRPHLISTDEFGREASESFATGTGAPAYPSQTLPPNAFLSAGATSENHSQRTVGAVAAAIVGCIDRVDPLAMRYGYIEINNGPRQVGPQGAIALQGKDIFCHALSGEGIFITGTQQEDYFCTGNETETTKSLDVDPNMTPAQLEALLANINDQNLFVNDEIKRLLNEANDLNITQGPNGWYNTLRREAVQILKENNYIDQWYFYNRIHNELVKAILWKLNIPDRGKSLRVIRHRGGSDLNDAQKLRHIDRHTNRLIFWHDYQQVKNSNDPELVMLDAFKKGYDQYGSADSGHIMPTGFTTLEQFKVNVMTQRTGCINCASVQAPAQKSGVKFFDHTLKYPSPQNSWNFGQVKTPYDYLTMIDTVPNSRPCAATTVIDKLTQRCQLIKPGVSRDEVVQMLKSQPLPLQSSLYIYLDGNDLKLHATAPRWAIPATRPDGLGSVTVTACGAPYDVIGTLVNCSSEPPNGPVKKLSSNPEIDPNTDGHYPGWAWRHSPTATCTDNANFVPSSGYNHLLGALQFTNSCAGGGQFCEPN